MVCYVLLCEDLSHAVLWFGFMAFPNSIFPHVDVLFHNYIITIKLNLVASNYILNTSDKMKSILLKILNPRSSKTCFVSCDLEVEAIQKWFKQLHSYFKASTSSMTQISERL